MQTERIRDRGIGRNVDCKSKKAEDRRIGRSVDCGTGRIVDRKTRKTESRKPGRARIRKQGKSRARKLGRLEPASWKSQNAQTRKGRGPQVGRRPEHAEPKDRKLQNQRGRRAQDQKGRVIDTPGGVYFTIMC